MSKEDFGMNKPLKFYSFRIIDGIWQDVAGSGDVLADVLSEYGIVIDDRAQFCRLIDLERQIIIVYRAYGVLKIELTVNKLH